MKLSPIRITPSARLIAGFYLMAAFWPHRMKKRENSGQNPAIELFGNFPELLQTTLFREVTWFYRSPVVLSSAVLHISPNFPPTLAIPRFTRNFDGRFLAAWISTNKNSHAFLTSRGSAFGSHCLKSRIGLRVVTTVPRILSRGVKHYRLGDPLGGNP